MCIREVSCLFSVEWPPVQALITQARGALRGDTGQGCLCVVTGHNSRVHQFGGTKFKVAPVRRAQVKSSRKWILAFISDCLFVSLYFGG